MGTLKYSILLGNLYGQPILIFFTSGTKVRRMVNSILFILFYSGIFLKPSRLYDKCIGSELWSSDFCTRHSIQITASSRSHCYVAFEKRHGFFLNSRTIMCCVLLTYCPISNIFHRV